VHLITTLGFRRLFQKAIIHYLKARRYNKQYVKQTYYLQELGGALFLYKKYHFSAMLYKMALDKGAPESCKTLYADALMFSGKYQSALDIFSEYLKSNKDEHDEWHLKKICLERLIKITDIKEQTRHSLEALESVRIARNDGDDCVKSLEKAVELDMLCGLAWFNLGVEYSKRGKHEDAVYSFTFCGLVQDWDVKAWVNATLCSLNKETPIHMVFFIVRTAYFYHGDYYLKKVYEEINKRGPSEFLDLFSSTIEEILPRNKVGERKTITRIMGKDGVFREVSDNGKIKN
jgi:tetratricopeptide (TPR) repeat protein